MKWQNLFLSVLIIALIASCSSLESSASLSFNTQQKIEIKAPEIPFNKDQAFFPLRYREDGKILPSYQWKDCVKKFIVCIKWEKKIVYFEDLSWFHANGYGLTKLRK